MQVEELKQKIESGEILIERSPQVSAGQIQKASGGATLSKIANHQGYNATADVIDQLCTYFEVPIQDLVTHVPDKKG